MIAAVGKFLIGLKDRTLFLIFFSLALIVSYVVKVSFMPDYPFVQTDAVVLVRHTPIPGIVLLTEVRKLKGFYGIGVDSNHELYEKANPVNKIKVDGISFQSEKGPFTIVSAVTLPLTVQGTWCSSFTYSWWPSFSQRSFSVKSPDVCFDTTEYD